eukprot:5134182-Karenia_brevis.AAC.1
MDKVGKKVDRMNEKVEEAVLVATEAKAQAAQARMSVAAMEAEVHGLKKDMEAMKTGDLTIDVQRAVDVAMEAKWPKLGGSGYSATVGAGNPWAGKGAGKGSDAMKAERRSRTL